MDGGEQGQGVDVVALHGRAVDTMRRVIDRVRPDQLGAATPCSEWDVRALLNHVVGGNRMAVALLAGEAPPDRNADHLGDDPQGAFGETAAVAEAALRAEGALERTVRMHFGEVPARMLVGLRFADLTVHAWDLAKATGQPTELDPELCEIALRMARARLDGMPRPPGGPVGPEVPVPAEAPACDRLAGFMGRTV